MKLSCSVLALLAVVATAKKPTEENKLRRRRRVAVNGDKEEFGRRPNSFLDVSNIESSPASKVEMMNEDVNAAMEELDLSRLLKSSMSMGCMRM